METISSLALFLVGGINDFRCFISWRYLRKSRGWVEIGAAFLSPFNSHSKLTSSKFDSIFAKRSKLGLLRPERDVKYSNAVPQFFQQMQRHSFVVPPLTFVYVR